MSCCGNCQSQNFKRLLTRSLTLARSFTKCVTFHQVRNNQPPRCIRARRSPHFGGSLRSRGLPLAPGAGSPFGRFAPSLPYPPTHSALPVASLPAPSCGAPVASLSLRSSPRAVLRHCVRVVGCARHPWGCSCLPAPHQPPWGFVLSALPCGLYV